MCGIGFGRVTWTGGYPVNPHILPILILTRGFIRWPAIGKHRAVF